MSPNGPTFLRTDGARIAPQSIDTVAAADQRLIEALSDYIPHAMRLTGAPGLNIALARRGRIIWDAAFGHADLERQTPATPDTVVHSGSMAKVYTSVAALQLVERGALALDAPINSYLKAFQVDNPLGKREVTVCDLLTHRSGLHGDAAGSTYDIPADLETTLKRGYASDSFPFYGGSWRKRWVNEVGGPFSYSNFGMATLGYLVQVANPQGLSFSDYLQRQIIEPLGMTSTQFPQLQAPPHARADLLARCSTGYAALGHVLVKTPTVYFADFPAGGVLTTARDHVRLIMALANKGRLEDCQLLRPETVEAMLTPQTDLGPSFLGEPMTFGLGLQLVATGTPQFSFGHGGAHMFGWVNMFRAFPELDFAYAVFTNHWTILPTRTGEALMIEELIRNWLRNEAGRVAVARDPQAPDWAWKTSYVAGVVLAEQLMGLLGIEQPLSDEAVEIMAREAFLHAEIPNFASGWDPDGFRQGIIDMQGVPMTIESIRRAVADGRLRVTAEELETIGRQFGLPGTPILMPLAG